MKMTERSKGGLALHISGLVEAIHGYEWHEYNEVILATTLRESVKNVGEEAKAYSIVKEIIRRKTGLALFDTQLMAAYAMVHGRIAELPTGEGKTLAAVVAAILLAFQGKSVHILVFNDYLANRDFMANRAIYEACGLSCGCIVESSNTTQRKTAYGCDVLYIAAKEAGFDCLRDFLHTQKVDLLFPPLQVALVDEADSILIDEARIPLVLAGNAEERPSVTVQISTAVAALSGQDVGVAAESNQAWLTDSGVAAMEAALRIDNLFLPEHADLLAMIHAALEARFLLRKDRDYIVRDEAIEVIDESTGRVAEDRRFPDLLHQAVEVQELGRGEASSLLYNSMSMQAFLRQYPMLCGMTGTAASSAYEFRKMYELEIEVIAPHTPCVRVDHTDAVYENRQEQEAAVLEAIQRSYAKGQPVLLGTQSVEESEHYSRMLITRGIPHNVLNARNDEQEAAVIADAGRAHQVTISTNMAGRGVDIRLGGSDETEADRVRAAGGLFVMSTGINRSIRIDNQLRGRAGRQGDPGESRFFVCLQDVKPDAAGQADPYSHMRYPKLVRRAQKEQESKDIEARYMLERYSAILEAQRQRITAYRMQILTDVLVPGIVKLEDAEGYEQLVQRAGARGVGIAEKQLTLYFINMNWAAYLDAMETMRDGIHLMVIGRKSPLDEYVLFAAAAFDEMLADIQRDVVERMRICVITEDGVDMEAEGLIGATTTWTYMINESTTQFSRIPQIIKSMTAPITGTLFSVRGIYWKLRHMITMAFFKPKQ